MALLAGTSQIKITPLSSVYLAGYAARKTPSEGIHDELFAKSLYMEKDNDKIAIVSLDLLGLPLESVNKIRKQVMKKLGFDNIIIACTHTHSGPNTIRFLNTEIDHNWHKSLIEKVVKVIISSANKKSPAYIGVGKTKVDNIGKNRRANNGATDSELGIIKVTSLQGDIISIIINFTCHPTVLGANNMLVSADYPAYIYKYLGEHYPNAVIMFTNGAAGDINIGYSADDSALGKEMNIRTYENAAKIGKKISDEVIQVVTKIKTTECNFSYKRKQISLPLKEKLPTLKELKSRLDNIKRKLTNSVNQEEKKKLLICQIYYEILQSKINNLVDGNTFRKSEIDFLYLDGAVLVTIPGELFCELGLEIKQLFPYKNVFIIGYANDYISYIPTKEAFAKGGYEVETSIYSDMVGETLVSIIKNEILKNSVKARNLK